MVLWQKKKKHFACMIQMNSLKHYFMVTPNFILCCFRRLWAYAPVSTEDSIPWHQFFFIARIMDFTVPLKSTGTAM